MERERLDRPRASVHNTYSRLHRGTVCTWRIHTRGKERQKWVGCANHFLLGTLGLRNNRILVRAASRREDVHRCEKEKSSLYARMTLFSHTNCVETRSRAHAVHERQLRTLLQFLRGAVQFYTRHKFRQIVRNHLDTIFMTWSPSVTSNWHLKNAK